MDFQLNVDTDTVGRLPLKKPVCVTPDTTVRDALRVMQQHHTGAVMVVENERLRGIFTERDALPRMAACEGLDERLATAMEAAVVTVEIDDSVATAVEKMSEGGYRRLPVVKSERPRGMLSVSGILHYLVEHFPQVVYTLPPEPHHSPQNREGA